MLIFTRKLDEEFFIGENKEINIKILGFPRRGMVKIGITAPKEVTIHRKEIWEKIEQLQKKEEGK